MSGSPRRGELFGVTPRTLRLGICGILVLAGVVVAVSACDVGGNEEPDPPVHTVDGPTPGGSLPSITHDQPAAEYLDASLSGELEAIEAGAAVYFVVTVIETDERIGLVLPYGFSASVDGTAILDENGVRAVEVPGVYDIGGGQYGRSTTIWDGGPAVDDLWMSADTFRPVE